MYQKVLLYFIVLIAVSNIQTTFCLIVASVSLIQNLFPNDTKYVDLSKFVLKKVNRTRVISGSFETFFDYDNSYQMLATLSKKTGNEFRILPYKLGPKPFCTFFDDGDMFMPEARKISNLPEKGVCPWVKNVYRIHDYKVNWEKIPKYFTAGEYMAEIQGMKNGVITGGVRVFGVVEYSSIA